MTLNFDLLTLKLVRESYQRWGTFLSNLGTLGFWVLKLFAMYATDRRTDGQKQSLLPPFLWAGHNNRCKYFCDLSYKRPRYMVYQVVYIDSYARYRQTDGCAITIADRLREATLG